MKITNQHIKALMFKLGLKQEHLARELDYNKGYLSRIINGREDVPKTLIDKIKAKSLTDSKWSLENIEQHYLNDANDSETSSVNNSSVMEELRSTNEYLREQLTKAMDTINKLSITNSNLVDKLGKLKGSHFKPLVNRPLFYSEVA